MNTVRYEKHVHGEVVARFNVSPADADVIDSFLAEKAAPTAHGNSKAVVIYGPVDEEIYFEHVRLNGAKPIKETLFPSSKAASCHLGYKTDQVGYALRQAKQRGEDTAVVAGVPLRRLSDIRD